MWLFLPSHGKLKQAHFWPVHPDQNHHSKMTAVLTLRSPTQ